MYHFLNLFHIQEVPEKQTELLRSLHATVQDSQKPVYHFYQNSSISLVEWEFSEAINGTCGQWNLCSFDGFDTTSGISQLRTCFYHL